MNNYNFWLIKFGTLNHLKSLQNGKIYLTHIQRYREDNNLSRGDRLEGKHPILPENFDVKDMSGDSIYKNIPKTNEIFLSLSGDEDLLLFCTSALDSYSLEILSKERKLVEIKESYLMSMQDFGDYALIFNHNELDNIMDQLYKEGKIQYGSIGPVEYVDKTKPYSLESKSYIPKQMREYYYKDIEYERQNEWRMILDGVHEKRNENGDCLLDIKPFENSILLPVADLRRQLFCISGNRLKFAN